MLFLRFCLFCGIALTFAPFFSSIDARASMFQAYALQLAAGTALLALVMLAFRRGAWAFAGLIAAFWNMALAGPAITAHAKVAEAADRAVSGKPLKVISLNFWYENPDPKATVAYLAKSGADVIGLSEMTADSKAALEPLKATYPYSVDCAGKVDYCDLMLLSKKPLRYPFAGKIGAKLTYVASADIDWQGRLVSIAMAHVFMPFVAADTASLQALVPADDPSPMLPGTPALWQSMQTAVLAEYAKTLGPERIVMGDFNSAPWSDVQAAFRSATGLENRGHLVPSWPAWAPLPLRIPIDTVFVGGKLALGDFKAGPNVGSDHLPVVAEIAVPAP